MTKQSGKCIFIAQHIPLYQICIRTRCITHNSIQKITSVDYCRKRAWVRQLSWNPNQGCDVKLPLLFFSWTLHQRGKGHKIDKSILSQVFAGLKNSMNLIEYLLQGVHSIRYFSTVVVSTAAFYAVRGMVPGLGSLKGTKNVSSPSHIKLSVAGSLRD